MIKIHGKQVLAYVAGPFRAADAWGIAENVHSAARVALCAWRKGFAVICPHLNTAQFQGAAPDELWLEGDLEIMRRCDVVLLAPKWERSSGTRAEIVEAVARGIPVFGALPEILSSPLLVLDGGDVTGEVRPANPSVSLGGYIEAKNEN